MKLCFLTSIKSNKNKDFFSLPQISGNALNDLEIAVFSRAPACGFFYLH